MLLTWILVLFVSVEATGDKDFPPEFQFGAATSAYQVEGTWSSNGRTPSVWDEYVHKKPEAIEDHSTGDVACDSYHQWRRDVEMAAELGLDFYRFSISWTRLFPGGFSNSLNEDGRRYYSDLIDSLMEQGIKPVVTLYHWDLPQKFQDLGGWANPLVVEWFEEYAGAVFSLYADRVLTWITINEPIAICDGCYEVGLIAPAISSPGFGTYICAKNVLLAHARAWRLYDEKFRPKYGGKIAITNNHIWFEPAAATREEVAELARQLYVGIYSHPIYSTEGGWPPLIEKLISDSSLRDGYKQSRLPPFTSAEKELIKGTYDFHGLNYYTSRIVRKAKTGEKVGSWPLSGSPEWNLVFAPAPNWQKSGVPWAYVHPEGFRRQLKWFKEEYGDVEILITENGYADYGEDLYDGSRINYYKEHLEQVLLSIHEDGVRVTAYTAWSLMDNFEWWAGYGPKFGLYAVDFTSAQRTRTPRASAHYYAELIRHRSLHFHFTYTSGERRLYSCGYIHIILVCISVCLIQIDKLSLYTTDLFYKIDISSPSSFFVEKITSSFINTLIIFLMFLGGRRACSSPGVKLQRIPWTPAASEKPLLPCHIFLDNSIGK